MLKIIPPARRSASYIFVIETILDEPGSDAKKN
jgi:hypothetical protein